MKEFREFPLVGIANEGVRGRVKLRKITINYAKTPQKIQSPKRRIAQPS